MPPPTALERARAANDKAFDCRPPPTPAPGPGASLFTAGYTQKRVGGYLAWNGLGVVIGLCASCDLGVDFGALLILLSVAGVVSLVVGLFMWCDNMDAGPPSESGGPG